MKTRFEPEVNRWPGNAFPLVFLAPLAAAAVGALGWAALAYLTGYEVGYAAWAIGGLVGLATVKTGGRGTTYACIAAALTVAGIVGGKVLGTHLIVHEQLGQTWEAAFTPSFHEELLADATDFARLPEDAGDGELRHFLVDHGYTPADSPEGVTVGELEAFRSFDVPRLRELHATRPSYEDWYASSIEESRQSFQDGFSALRASVEGLNGIDALFAFLAVSTAFGMVRRSGSPVPVVPSEGVSSEDHADHERRAA